MLAEWLKFSLQLNIEDETIRNQLTTMMLSFVSETEHSFVDYESKLRNGKFILKGDKPQLYEVVIDGESMSQVPGENITADEALQLLD